MRFGLLAVAVLAGALAPAAAAIRQLQQEMSSASAVSVAGGEGPYGNCGATQTVGNAAAYASGPPCNSVIIPAPPPTATCPATTVTVDWQLPPAGTGYKNLTLCPGSTVAFKWNTGKPAVTYGLYQIPGPGCPGSASERDVKLIITPASSPNQAGVVSATLNAPGTYYFADFNNCAKGQKQGVIISSTAPPLDLGHPTSSPSQATHPGASTAGRPVGSVGGR